MSAVPHPRKIRSFVRRPGRLTEAQKRALAELMPRYGVPFRPERVDLREVFGRDAPRVLDIGFGDGEALLTAAANAPHADHLGVEVHEPGIGHLLLLLDRAGTTNVRVIARDAAEVVPLMLGDATFDVVNIYFPDPWPKKRHHKRRLVQPPFVAELVRILKPRGYLHVATDWADYAEHMRLVLDATPELEGLPAEAFAGDPLAVRPPTKFERRGLRLGHEVYDGYYRKR
jgi:tRNA (guanine-N7-)-methyltransferase